MTNEQQQQSHDQYHLAQQVNQHDHSEHNEQQNQETLSLPTFTPSLLASSSIFNDSHILPETIVPTTELPATTPITLNRSVNNNVKTASDTNDDGDEKLPDSNNGDSTNYVDYNKMNDLVKNPSIDSIEIRFTNDSSRNVPGNQHISDHEDDGGQRRRDHEHDHQQSANYYYEIANDNHGEHEMTSSSFLPQPKVTVANTTMRHARKSVTVASRHVVKGVTKSVAVASKHSKQVMKDVSKTVTVASKHHMRKASRWLYLTSDVWIPTNREISNIPIKDLNEPIQLSSSVRIVSSSSHSVAIEHPRSIRRRIHLILTEPESSKVSAIIFAIIVACVGIMNVVMVLQTMSMFQMTPPVCDLCDGVNYENGRFDKFMGYKNQLFNPSDIAQFWDGNNEKYVNQSSITCQCPPVPYSWMSETIVFMIYFFSAEVILRILSYEPPYYIGTSRIGYYYYWIKHYILYLISPRIIIDALAVFPYYAPKLTRSNGLLPLVVFRIFQVFYLVRLGQYNRTFVSFVNVLNKAYLYIRILILVLLFGALIFGSLIYYLEHGEWEYYEPLGAFTWVRNVTDYEQEPSPFVSIPASFWWFIVTATTVGYGDMVPVTPLGRFVASFAMIMGVLVIAFPVGVFTDLWSVELKRLGTLRDALNDNDLDDSNHDDTARNYDITGKGEDLAQGQDNVGLPSHILMNGGTNDTTHCDNVVSNANMLASSTTDITTNDGLGQRVVFKRNQYHNIAASGKTIQSDQTMPSARILHGNMDVDDDIDENLYTGNGRTMFQEMLDDNYVAVHKDDLFDMIYHLQVVCQSQEQIRKSQRSICKILKAYKNQIIENQNATP